MVPNTTFEVAKVDGQIVGTYVTDNRGSVVVPVNESGYYRITEVLPADGYLLSEISEQIINVQFNIENEVTFLNDKKAGLEIVKIDKDTGRLLAKARYRVSQTDGTIIGEYTTNSAGKINIQDLDPQWIEVVEISAPSNYIRDETIHKIQIVENEVTTLTLTNKHLQGIQIIKKDSVTEKPLANASFSVTEVGGSLIGEYTTDEMGVIEIQNLEPGFYEIKETNAPRGYLIDTETKIVEVTSRDSVVVEFYDTAKGGLQIKKVDEKTGEPLANAKFRVTTITGQTLGEYSTSRTGFINLPELDDGWYIIEETQAPDGYILDNTPKTVEVHGDKPTIVEFDNRQKGGLQILKIDAATGVPLENAKFRVTTKSGLLIGEYETDKQGHINLSGLDNGWYTILEIEAPKGYILDDVKKDVEVTSYKNQIVEFTNKAKAGLQIMKVDSVTKEGLKDVKFKVTKLNGELIGTYMTDASGMIFITDLNEGWVIVQEVSTRDGYKIDTAPRNVEIKSNVATLVEFENHPYASLIIEKIDAVTGKGMANVQFNITKENGEFVGNFKTDEFGRIKFTKTLTPATYLIKETSSDATNGYKVDTETKEVKLDWGDNKNIQIKNYPYGSLKVIKMDSITKDRLDGVKYKLEDAEGKLIGKYTTNEHGEFCIDNKLEAGMYYLTEINSLENYITDTEKHKLVINWGKTTTIELKNTEITGKIQIIKKSLDNNEYTGKLEKSLLDGATFEIYDEDNNFIQKVTTSNGGVATSKELPYGIYKVKETSSPRFYLPSDKEYTVEIKQDGKTEILEVYDESVKLGTSVNKSGVRETQCLDVIRYDFTNIKNRSNVSLNNFVWHDSLPIQTTIQKIYTGTWNQNLNYKVSFKTNLNKNYRLFKDNLFTNKNYELDFTSIPLQTDEYITDYIFEFGTVKAGFSQVEAPFIFVKVNNFLNDGTEFVNYTEVMGYYYEIKVTATDSWKTTIYNKTIKPVKLPKTGM